MVCVCAGRGKGECGKTFARPAVRIQLVSDLALAAISADGVDADVLTAVVLRLTLVVLCVATTTTTTAAVLLISLRSYLYHMSMSMSMSIKNF